ncbi:O-antigen polymerase [Pedobacter psychroterrae]|uniref:Oligosaccharide repeat unit polymerase n=1 Tax=Pedobacter psychroterrae TaxID=2530453 RepID=A0A4R0N9Q7_9SPHI|nr:O-antigen polymerase [Pedobacter psychroterrae]TCC96815.1 oligosaccharide repeat unit polymerase [Pedobacter psychroterrae]
MNNIERISVAIAVTSAINLFMLLALNVPFDWYLLPLTVCGIISVYQIVYLIDITRQHGLRLPLVFYFYCTLWFSCYLAPLLHFALNFWLIFNNSLILPGKWEPYVLIIATMNAIGLILFVFAYRFFYGLRKPQNKIYLLQSNKKLNYVYLLCFISFAFQIFIYSKLGGISGFIAAYEARGEEQSFAGYGILFIISEFFPIALVFIFYIKALYSPKLRNGKNIFIFLAILFVACIFFGGLRGSRSNTVLTMVQACLILHFFIRKFQIKEMVIGVAFLVSFMYVYKFYKQGGTEAVTAYTEGKLDVSEYKYNFDVFDMLLTDFARADIQPYLVYRYDNSNYQPKLGETYLGFIHFFPAFMVDKSAITTKKTAATELLYNYKGDVLGFYTTRIFGLLGEYILNFGYYTAFLIFLPLAFFIAALDKWVYSLAASDVRNFIVPLWILFVITLFNADLDNAIFFYIKRIFPVMVMLWLVTDKFLIKRSLE